MNREFKDQIPPEGGRKYRITENPDGTSGISDVTEYQQEGTPFGAKEAMELYDGIVPPGAVIPYAGSSAPDGWLLCDGRTVSRTTYAALFAVIGVTYGAGDGNTTFALPNLQGRVAAGTSSSHPLASKAGADSKNIEVKNIPSLSTAIAVAREQTQSESRDVVQTNYTNKYAFSTSGVKSGDGTNTAFDVRQATLYLNYIIKY